MSALLPQHLESLMSHKLVINSISKGDRSSLFFIGTFLALYFSHTASLSKMFFLTFKFYSVFKTKLNASIPQIFPDIYNMSILRTLQAFIYIEVFISCFDCLGASHFLTIWFQRPFLIHLHIYSRT